MISSVISVGDMDMVIVMYVKEVIINYIFH
nr:MAG TPA: hypothetical protein [Caudoviricetes sp.]